MGQVVLATKGRPSAAMRKIEKQEAFQDLVRWRSGSEGRISCLKRDFGWTQTSMDGLEGGPALVRARGVQPQSGEDRCSREQLMTR